MNKNWPTKDKDMNAAQKIMEEYALKSNSHSLGFFELVVNTAEKKMNFRISQWIVSLAQHFNSLYGADQGDVITRQILTECLTRGHTIH